MKKVILATICFALSSASFALPIVSSANQVTHDNVTRNVTLQNTHDAETFKDIMQENGFYSLLLSMHSEVPDVAHAAEYVMLLNELHLMNQKLSIIAGCFDGLSG